VFELSGIDPLTERRFAVHIEMPLVATLLDFLFMVMRTRRSPCGSTVQRTRRA
jgi:hypothetical protein